MTRNGNDNIALITGGSSPIMEHVALSLLERDYHVVLTTRDKTKIRLPENLAKYLDNQLTVMDLELSSIGSVEAFAAQFKQQFKALHILVAHAGIKSIPDKMTVDGYESTFATNYLGHFVLLMRLLELMTNVDRSKIIITSSKTLKNKKIDYEYLSSPSSKLNKGFLRSLLPLYSYGVSNLCRMLLVKHLSENTPQNVEISGVFPGFCATSCNLPKNQFLNSMMKYCYNTFFNATTPVDAAQNYIALCDASTNTNGLIYNVGVVTKVDDWGFKKEEETELLYQMSKRFTGMMEQGVLTKGISEPKPLYGSFDNISSTIDRVSKEKNPNKIFAVRRFYAAVVEHLINSYKIRNVHLRNQDLLKVCLDKNLIKEVVKLLDSTDLIMYRSNVFKVNPGGKGVGHWHADAHRIGVQTQNDKYVTVWVAFSDIDESNGFEYIYGSNETLHNGCCKSMIPDPYLNSLFKVPRYIVNKYTRPTILKRGEFICFGNKLVHRSIRNTSADVRYAIAFRFVPSSAVLQHNRILTYKSDRLLHIKTDRDAGEISHYFD